MGRLKMVLAFLLALTVIVLIVQNTKSMETRVLFYTVETPLALLLGLTGLAGFAMGVLTSLSVSRRSAPKQ